MPGHLNLPPTPAIHLRIACFVAKRSGNDQTEYKRPQAVQADTPGLPFRRERSHKFLLRSGIEHKHLAHPAAPRHLLLLLNDPRDSSGGGGGGEMFRIKMRNLGLAMRCQSSARQSFHGSHRELERQIEGNNHLAQRIHTHTHTHKRTHRRQTFFKPTHSHARADIYCR